MKCYNNRKCDFLSTNECIDELFYNEVKNGLNLKDNRKLKNVLYKLSDIKFEQPNNSEAQFNEEKNELVYKLNVLGIGKQSEVKVEVKTGDTNLVRVDAHNSNYDYKYSFVVKEPIDIDNSYIELYGGILMIKFKIKPVEERTRTIDFKLFTD